MDYGYSSASSIISSIPDDACFNQSWAGVCRDRWAGTRTVTGLVRWLWALDSSAKSKKQIISTGDCPLPLRCLSQFFPDKRKDQLLKRANFLRTFHRWGGLVFIAYALPNWMVVRILSHWMGYFLPLSLSD